MLVFCKYSVMQRSLQLFLLVAAVGAVSATSLHLGDGGKAKSLINSGNRYRKPVVHPLLASKQASSPANVQEGDATIPTSVFNLAKSIIGAGVLSLPNGVAVFADGSTSALIPSSIICTIFGLAAAYSFSSIGRVCKEYDSKSFQDVWAKSVDPKSGIKDLRIE